MASGEWDLGVEYFGDGIKKINSNNKGI